MNKKMAGKLKYALPKDLYITNLFFSKREEASFWDYAKYQLGIKPIDVLLADNPKGLGAFKPVIRLAAPVWAIKEFLKEYN